VRLGYPLSDQETKQNIADVLRDSSMLDPRSKVKIDI